jgi:general stress protein 26
MQRQHGTLRVCMRARRTRMHAHETNAHACARDEHATTSGTASYLLTLRGPTRHQPQRRNTASTLTPEEIDMKINPNMNEDMRRLATRLKGQRSAMLSTVDADGRINARPMTPIEMSKNGDIWMMVSRKSPWLHPLSEPQQVNLSFVDVDDGLHVSVTGVARLSDDMSRKIELWSAVARPWFPDGVEDPDLVLLVVQPQAAEVWDGPDNAAERLLALAVSVVASRPIGMGHRETITTNHATAPDR